MPYPSAFVPRLLVAGRDLAGKSGASARRATVPPQAQVTQCGWFAHGLRGVLVDLAFEVGNAHGQLAVVLGRLANAIVVRDVEDDPLALTIGQLDAVAGGDPHATAAGMSRPDPPAIGSHHDEKLTLVEAGDFQTGSGTAQCQNALEEADDALSYRKTLAPTREVYGCFGQG